jgi:hypothetical protein
MRDRNLSYELETPRVRWRLAGREEDSSCKAETPRARRRFVGRDGNSSCEAETCWGSLLLVRGEVSCH